LRQPKFHEAGTECKASSGKQTRHFNIKYFCVADLIEQKELHVQHCSTDDMVADCMTKPLKSPKFDLFWSIIMNFKEQPKQGSGSI